MKTIMMFALTILTSTSALAQRTTYVDIPADEAAMARSNTDLREIDATAPSIDQQRGHTNAVCQRLVKSAAARWAREKRVHKAHHQTTSELRAYQQRKCGGTVDFYKKMVAEANRSTEAQTRDHLSRSVGRASNQSTQEAAKPAQTGFEATMSSIGLGALTGSRLPEAIKPPTGGWSANRAPAQRGGSNR